MVQRSFNLTFAVAARKVQEAIAQIVIELQLPIPVVAIAWERGVKLEDAARV